MIMRTKYCLRTVHTVSYSIARRSSNSRSVQLCVISVTLAYAIHTPCRIGRKDGPDVARNVAARSDSDAVISDQGTETTPRAPKPFQPDWKRQTPPGRCLIA